MPGKHVRFALLGLGLIAIVAVAAIQWDNSGTRDAESVRQDGRRRLSASQQAAMQTLSATVSVDYLADEQGQVVQITAEGADFTDEMAAALAAFEELREVQLKRTTIGPKGLAALGALPNLQFLQLEESSITDADLTALAESRTLSQLFLAGTSITDQGMPAVGQLSGLQTLDLSRTAVSDTGLSKLASLKQLQRLYLNGTAVTGTGLAGLPEDNRIVLLSLKETPITVEGIQELGRLRRLQSLYLDGAALRPETIEPLMQILVAHCPDLATLSMANTPLTDAAVKPLSALNRLDKLSIVSLQGTQISKSAFIELASATPEVRYQVDYPPGRE